LRSVIKGSVGTIVGETTPLAFKFLISGEVGRSTYIKVKADGRDWILAQVEDVKRSNTAYSMSQINGSASKDYEAKEMMIAEARVIGVGSNGRLRLPTSPARPGDPVFVADERLIKATLGLSKGEMYIGHLRGYDIHVELDANTLVQKHCSVLAKTGSGKSYTAAVILEELLEKNVALLIIDPHGEYASMKEPNREGDFNRYKVKPRGYDVTVYTPAEMAVNPRADRPLRFNSLNLAAREVAKMIPHESTSGQIGLLYEAISSLQAETDVYTLEDIIDQVVKSTSKVKWNLVGQLESLLEIGLFSGTATPIEDLLRPGKASVIDMTGVTPDIQAMIVSRLLAELFEARKRRQIAPGMVVVEEAHNYIPERGSGSAASTDIIRTIAAEGRKFGLGLMVISQRPARVDKNVISQCNTQIIMRVTNPNDLKALSKGLEGMTSELEEEIKRLPPGVAMLVSNEIERPITVNIRPRRSKHGGVSTTIVSKGQSKSKAKVPEKGSGPETIGRARANEKSPSKESGGILKKMFGTRRA
jgi:DNA helicase HerA-like ATPase